MTTRGFIQIQLTIILACVVWTDSSLHAVTIVSPAKYAGTDAPGYASPWPDEGFRAVQIDDNSIFESLPDEGAWLTEIALRPDQTVRVGSEIHLDNFILRLSVTGVEPQEMSDIFAENYGQEVRVVYEGPWSATVESPAGRVRDFDYRIPLQTPFFYRPDDGNLLIDWNFFSPRGSLPGNTTQHDLTNEFVAETRTNWSASFGINSPIGSSGRFSSVVQFRFAIPGDFNDDRLLTVEDIDLLTDAIVTGALDPLFDLNRDGIVNSIDRATWIHDLKQTWFGDANLDGEFSSVDFVVVFQAGKFETRETSSWKEGDWNGDGEFSSADFVVAFLDGGYEAGPRAAMAQVPEPSAAVLLIGGLLGYGGAVLHVRRGKRR